MTSTKDDQECGCGISKIWLTSPEDPFIKACKWHDQAYTKDSLEQSVFSRLEVDRLFLALMLAIADSKDSRIRLKSRAYFYYYLVRIFGAKYWEGSK